MDKQDDTPASVLQPSATSPPGADVVTRAGEAVSRVVTKLHVRDTSGDQYHIDYFHFPGPPQDSNRHNLQDPCMSGVRESLEFLGQRVFPNYDEQMLANWIRWRAAVH